MKNHPPSPARPDLTRTTRAWLIRIGGRVQGVGFRPFVARLAQRHELNGWVRNCAGTVEIHVEGSPQNLSAFRKALLLEAPPLARPETPERVTVEVIGLHGFTIRSSAVDDRGTIHIPPDQFVCEECLAEMSDPNERRYRYPFINCTQCGPRYTLIERLPYDRPNTAMADFPLCPACRREYDDSTDRRYHAQPLACARCGPRLRFSVPRSPAHDTLKARMAGQGAETHVNELALSEALGALRRGEIVAVKGVGGYHLMCDARNAAAVRRLRQRKQRPAKPLALLTPWRGADGLALVDTLAHLHPVERERLVSPERPIILATRRADSGLPEEIAPGLDEIGLMLPYSPLHHLLADGFDAPLVATSANLSGEPVLTEAAEVESRLKTIADAFLHHDRPILRPADDSLYRRIGEQMRPLRLGRGLAPLEMELPRPLPEPMLALGGDLKNTVALGFGNRIVISPHIGDLSAVRSLQVFEAVIGTLCRLYGIAPRRLVIDAHPDYHGSRWGAGEGLPVTKIPHHFAHAAALAGEHRLTANLIVFTWDGTGFGEDGTLWGGETLIGRPGHWRRWGALRPFRLPGGERVSREPWRSACALCWEAGLEWPKPPPSAALLKQAWQRGLNAPLTHSAGRLFDGAAALMGLIRESHFEGQAPLFLESVSRPLTHSDPTPPTLSWEPSASGLWLGDWRGLLPMLMDDSLSLATRGGLFHASLAACLVDQARLIRDQAGIGEVGLTGGVFQNRRLVEEATGALEKAGFKVWLPRLIPANDAGISFGQIIEAAARPAAP